MSGERQLETSYLSMEREGELVGSEALLMPNRDDVQITNGRDGGVSLSEGSGKSVAEVVHGQKKMKTMVGHTTKDVDAAWYVFDNLSCDQAEDLLRRHGDNGTYIVSHFHDPESYGLSIRIMEGEDAIYKHYSICIKEGKFQVESFSDAFKTIEQVVTFVQEKLRPTKLIPIFHKYNCETCDYSISMSADEPPTYNQAKSYPEAARKNLPLIVPIRPTLRRMMGGGAEDRGLSVSGQEEAQPSPEERNHGCCWKAFHTDPQGAWYKPHKAGLITGFILVIGWILFIVFFGWIVALALILVFILIIFAYILNFICTGRCKIEEDEN